ncbi:MAG: hypothetical protein KBD78_04270 [Oligoflexales bacterium]|nr:hypothetical protein [Oligoflexales bacterium]
MPSLISKINKILAGLIFASGLSVLSTSSAFAFYPAAYDCASVRDPNLSALVFVRNRDSANALTVNFNPSPVGDHNGLNMETYTGSPTVVNANYFVTWTMQITRPINRVPKIEVVSFIAGLRSRSDLVLFIGDKEFTCKNAGKIG